MAALRIVGTALPVITLNIRDLTVTARLAGQAA